MHPPTMESTMSQAKAAETVQWLAEHSLAEAVIEREAAVVRNVVLLGWSSRNGYQYRLEAMRQAVPLYEGRPVFIDHPQRSPTQRPLRDFAGQVLQPRFEGEKLWGDLRLLGPNTPWLLDLIEAAPKEIGLSHVVLGQRSTDGKAVERIEQVVSVDIVAFPATTQSFRENIASPGCPVQTLLERSSLPREAQSPALRELLATSGDPVTLLAALERCWQTIVRDRPCSHERQPAAPASGLSPAVKQALIACLKGQV